MGDKSPKQTAKLKEQRRAATAVHTGGRRAVATSGPNPSYGKLFRFRFGRVDVDGPWCLTEISKDDHRELIRFMRQMEDLTVAEVLNGRLGKREDVAGASPNGLARARAQHAFPDDHDLIHCLHMSGAKRLWGLQFENEFCVIWWDPNHEVWPARRVTDN